MQPSEANTSLRQELDCILGTLSYLEEKEKNPSEAAKLADMYKQLYQLDQALDKFEAGILNAEEQIRYQEIFGHSLNQSHSL